MNLKSLKAALAPLTKFGQDEINFEISDESGNEITVFLRPLVPKEEIECQKKAREILLQVQEEEGVEDSDDVSRAAAIQYFDSFRVEVISYALVQVGDQSFREVKHIETEETLPNGTPVKVPLNKALRDLIASEWSRSMITICWSKYGELVTKIAQKAEKVAEQSLADLDAEITRVSDRLSRLKLERENRAKGDPSVTMDQIRTLTNLGKALEEEINETIEQTQFEKALRERTKLETEAEKALQESETLEEEIPQEELPLAPPPPKTPPPPKEERKSVIPPQVPPPTSKPPPPPVEYLSSFEEADSPDSLRLQEEEALRILEAQRRAKLAGRGDIGGGVSNAQPMGAIPTASGQMIEAYRLPSETLSSRGNPEPPKAAKNQSSGNTNPNFIPPKR